jgi:hypothetical protein
MSKGISTVIGGVVSVVASNPALFRSCRNKRNYFNAGQFTRSHTGKARQKCEV